MRLIATQQFTYAGQPLKVGDEFEPTSTEDARILLGFGKAKPLGGGSYTTREMRGSSRRAYKRRDMQAED